MRPETKPSSQRGDALSRHQGVRAQGVGEALELLFPLWQRLDISQIEAGFAYQQLCLLPQRAVQYAKLLEEAIDLKARYQIALGRFQTCFKQFSMKHNDRRTALLAAAEYKTQLLIMCQLHQKQRQMTKHETFLPGFDYQSQEVFFKNIVSSTPGIEVLSSLLEQSEFCVQSDGVKLLQEYLQGKTRENASKRQVFLRSQQYACLQFLLGTDPPGSLSHKFKLFLDSVLEDYYLVQITEFNPALILKTFADDCEPLTQAQLAVFNVKVPFFGTSIPGQQLREFCGYSPGTARYGQAAIPQMPKAPGYTQFLLAGSFTTPSRKSRATTKRPGTEQTPRIQQTITEQQSTTVLFLRQFYNDGELFLDEQMEQAQCPSLEMPLQNKMKRNETLHSMTGSDDADLVVISTARQQIYPFEKTQVEPQEVDVKFTPPKQ